MIEQLNDRVFQLECDRQTATETLEAFQDAQAKVVAAHEDAMLVLHKVHHAQHMRLYFYLFIQLPII